MRDLRYVFNAADPILIGLLAIALALLLVSIVHACAGPQPLDIDPVFR